MAGETYVAGLDVAGEAVDKASERPRRDRADDRRGCAGRTARRRSAGVEVVRHYAWTGAPHAALHGALVALLRETWRVQRVVVDATGIGEPVAAFLTQALGARRVEAREAQRRNRSRGWATSC